MKAFRSLSRVLLMASLMIAGLAIMLHNARACPRTGYPCCHVCEEEPPTELCVSMPSDCDEQTSSAPIRYLDGVLKYKSPGLHIAGPGRGFSLRLGFNNRPHGVIDTDFNCGVNWWLEGVPFFEQRPDGTLIAIWGATSVAEFAPAGADLWEGLHGAKAGIEETTDGQETVYAMQGVYGTKAVFHHLDHLDPEKKGKVKKIVTPVGKEITFGYNSYGIDWILDTNVYTWNFAYPDGLLQSVEILDDQTRLGLMEMEYYPEGARWGLNRDLKKVTVTEYTSSGSAVTKTAYYAYHTDAYLAHRLRFVLDPETYAAASENGQIDLDIAYDEADDFRAVADYEFDYYTSGSNYLRVSSEKVRSVGCDCGAGRETGEFVYAYTLQAENAQNPYNNWVTQVVQTNPDLTKKIVRVNKVGAPIDVITEVTVDGTPKRWGMHYVYDVELSAGGRLLQRWYPSACDFSTGLFAPSSSGGGLIECYTYESTHGAVEQEYVKHGSGGTEIPITSYTYESVFPRITSVSTVVGRTLPIGTSVVSYAYSYYTEDGDPANNAQVRLKTMTLPAVLADQNGLGQPGIVRECFHPQTGKLLWREEKLDAVPAYRVVAYQYNEDALLVKQVSDPSSAMWSAMKSAMGLGTTVDDPNLETSGINAATDWTYDTWRRVSSMTGPEVQLETGTDRRETHYYYTKLANGHRVTLSCAHMPFNQFGAPVSIAVYDRDGRRVTSAMGVPGASGYLSYLIDTGGATLEAAFNGELFERRSWEYAGGQVVEEDVWENAENAQAPRYKTCSEYDNGLLKRRVDADGTIYNWTKVYSQNGYYIEESIGDVGEAVATARTYYNFTYGDLDSHPVDQEVAYVDGTSTITRTHTFDWRNRLSTTKLDGKNWVTVYGYDWANRVIGEETFYDADDNKAYGGADDRRIAMTVTYYDVAGRVYRSVSYEGDTAAGKTAIPDERETRHWYDLAGRAIKTRLPTGLLRKTVYDRLGRTLDEYTSYDDDTGTEDLYPYALTRVGDVVLEQASYSYDDAGNVTTVTRLSRYHDSPVSGDLTAVTTARPSYTSKWYDVLGRLVKTEHRGSENTPTDALVTQQTYIMFTGRLFETIDSKGMKTRFFFDNLGRQTRIIRNYVDGQIAGGDHGADQTIDLVYGAGSTETISEHDPFRVIERWTTDTLGTATKTQKTHYAYGVPKGDAYPNSLITSGKLLYKIGYADPTTGEAHFDPDEPNKAADAPYQETFAYDRQGRLTWRKGQAYSLSNISDAATHTYAYGVDGQILSDVATRRSDMEVTFDTVLWAYDNLGRTQGVQARTGGPSGTVANEVVYEYNGFGQATRSYQEHEGPKDADTLSVGYKYKDDAFSLPESITYPDDASDYTAHYRYLAGTEEYQKAGERLGRVSGVALETNVGNGFQDPDAVNVVSYDYIGAGAVLARKLDKSGVVIRADADGASWPLPPNAGYDGIDRFGRMKDLYVKKTTSPTATHNHIAYSYDAASNVTGRDEQAASVPDETYTYDGLHRLASATVATETPVTRDWTVTLAGNWKEVKDNGVVFDARTHNPENAITARRYGKSLLVPLYDKSGNMTRVPDDRILSKPKYATVTYDAWNRPVKIKDNGTSYTVAEYTYNGLGRVVKRVFPPISVTRWYYYDEGWRVLTERSSTAAGSSYRIMDYVWGAQYIDEVVCRIDRTQTPAVRMDFVQDANWNVITLLESDGDVAERYRYDAYGKPTFMNPNGTTKTTGILNSTYLFQGRRLIAWKNANVDIQAYHYRMREYLPVLGRFAQRDPIGVWGDGANAGNAVAYEGGAPIQRGDPLGMWAATDESKGRARRTYKWEGDGDTLEALSDIRGHDMDDVDKWARQVGTATAADGTPCEVSVPNTLYLDMGHRDFVDFFPFAMLESLRTASMQVASQWAEAMGNMYVKTDPVDARTVRAHMRNMDTFIYMYVGHGCSDGFGSLAPERTCKGDGVDAGRYTYQKIPAMILLGCSAISVTNETARATQRKVFEEGHKTPWSMNISRKGVLVGYSKDPSTLGEWQGKAPMEGIRGTTEVRTGQEERAGTYDHREGDD